VPAEACDSAWSPDRPPARWPQAKPVEERRKIEMSAARSVHMVPLQEGER
jgi:hypothetical protein